MDIYEIRRLRLLEIMRECCNDKAADLAKAIGRSDSYVTRMLYPEGKAGKKRIGEDMARHIAEVFGLSAGWLEGKDYAEEAAKKLENVTPTASAVARVFDTLSPAQQKALLSVIEGFGAKLGNEPGTSQQVGTQATAFVMPAQGSKQSSRSS